MIQSRSNWVLLIRKDSSWVRNFTLTYGWYWAHYLCSGQPGRCNMYLWTLSTPNRDGDLSNDIIVHEYTHGLTNRMTGGGSGRLAHLSYLLFSPGSHKHFSSRCLSTTESGGMGEVGHVPFRWWWQLLTIWPSKGWGDAMAFATQQKNATIETFTLARLATTRHTSYH